ncbi:alpha/beta hydrolase-fold protein [Enterobacter hormaechei]
MQRQKTVLAGSSYGGIASSWVALRYPRLFGNVLSLSGSTGGRRKATPRLADASVPTVPPYRCASGYRPGSLKPRGGRRHLSHHAGF